MKWLLQVALILSITNWVEAQKFRGQVSGKTFNNSAIEEIDSDNFPDKIKSFDYPNAEIADIVKVMSQLTGLNFIVDPKVTGKVSIIAPSEITVAEAFQAFLSALAIRGFTIIRSGAFWKVVSVDSTSNSSTQVYKGAYFPDADQLITKIIKVKYTSVKTLESNIKPFLSKNSKHMFYSEANTIVLTDYGSNIEKITQIIEALDVPNVHNLVEVIPITYAPAVDLAEKVNLLIRPLTSTPFRSSSRAGSNLINSKQNITATGISALIPDERTNSIIISGTQKGIERIRELIQQLDSKFDSQTSGGLFVYYVKYGIAEEIAKTLNAILQPKSSKKTSKNFTSRFSSSLRNLMGTSTIHDDIQITHDNNTNSLLITAKKHSFQALKTILDKIDIPKHQVFIKTIIMDLNAENALNWDITAYKFLGEGGSINGLLPRIGFSSQSLQNLFSQAPGKESILSFATGLMNVTSPIPWLNSFMKKGEGDAATSTAMQVPSLLSFVNLIKSTAGGNILSTPQLIAVDNEESSISVGVNAPVGTTETISDGIARSGQERKDINTELKITPRINPDGNSVRLSIEQKIDSISPSTVGASSLNENSVTITKRKIATNIILKDQETAILGGLMHDEETEENYKIPVLGDIPLLGWLFRAQDLKKVKKNLIIFITPQIIKSTADTQNIIKDHIDERIDFMKKFMNHPDRNTEEMYRILGKSAPERSSSTAELPLDELSYEEMDIIEIE